MDALGAQLNAKVEQQFAQDEATFGISKPGFYLRFFLAHICTQDSGTHLFPMQECGPKLNGLNASFLSDTKRGSLPSQRSGEKL
jgi:hypothetical protein